jgi:uncharacterized phage protein (TIGR02218 family)
MLDLPQGMTGEATTLARCWRLARRDGMVLGFTDHDRDLAFGDVTCRAATGLEAADAETALGMATGGGDLLGALTAASLTEADIARGRYDGASIETWLVNWRDPSLRLLIDCGTIGEVRRGEHGFTAEVRSLAAALDQERGRLFQAGCAADLGDERCKVDLGDPRYRWQGAVAATDGSRFVAVAGTDFESGFFSGGALSVLGGANAGAKSEIKSHLTGGGRMSFTLWQPLAAPIVPGDTVLVAAGCDKQAATCRERFGNLVNFRGFPRMPGNDFLLLRASDGQPGMDGGSLFE